MGLLLVLVNLRLVSQRMVRPENMPFLHTLLVLSSSSLESTRWTALHHLTMGTDSRKLRRKCLDTSRRLVTTLRPFHLFQSQDGMETTCWRLLPTWDGSRDGLLKGKRAMPRVLL